MIFCANVFIWQGSPPTSRPATPQGEAWRIAPPSTRRLMDNKLIESAQVMECVWDDASVMYPSRLYPPYAQQTRMEELVWFITSDFSVK